MLSIGRIEWALEAGCASVHQPVTRSKIVFFHPKFALQTQQAANNLARFFLISQLEISNDASSSSCKLFKILLKSFETSSDRKRTCGFPLDFKV